MRELLLLDDHPDVDTTTFLALCQQERLWSRRLQPHLLPGIDAFLVARAAQIPPDAVARLSAEARADIAERATRSPALADALAPMVALLAVDKAKTVRAAAVKSLDAIGEGRRHAALAPVLATTPVAQGAEVVEYLARTEPGLALLAEAAASGSKLATLVARATSQRAAIDVAPTPADIAIPAYTPLPEHAAGEQVMAELRRALDRMVRESFGDAAAREAQARRARGVRDADLRNLVDVANGTARPPAQVLQTFNVWWVAQAAPSLTLTHLLRLKKPHGNLTALVALRAESDTDLRAVERAVAAAGIDADLTRLARGTGWGYTPNPEVRWPWLVGHPEVVSAWLGGTAADKAYALESLQHYPALPPQFLPTLASLAHGDARMVRTLAQKVLAGHGAARPLAEQGLTDGKSEVRAASADWLAALGDPDAVGALRAALAKEKREVARAALLAALEALGADISADLSPDALGAEAARGLKGKPPASLGWFPFDQLPPARWADGTPVDPAVTRWWVILADKLKDPDGSGIIDRYLSLLEPASAAALGRFALAAWTHEDTRHPTEAESRAHAAVDGPQRHQMYQNWFANARARGNPNQHLIDLVAVPLDQHIQNAYAEHQATYLGSAIADKGLLALTTRLPGIELATAVQGYIRNHGARRSQVESLVRTLAANGEPAAVQLLLGVARRFKQATVQAAANELVAALAERRGWTAEELADRTTPAAGFGDDRLLHLDYGPRAFVGRVTATGTIALETADGAPIKSLPDPRSSDDAELAKAAKAQLTQSRKELKAVLAQQSDRLYEAMCVQRTWPAADWREFLADHPLVGQLVARLIWVADPGGDPIAFRPAEDGTLLDVTDADVDLPPDAVVQLAHRVLLGDATANAWRAHLADYGVTPLFDQLTNPAPTVESGADAIDTFRGHLTDTFTFRGVATKRGYQRGQAEDGGWFTEYSKQFTSTGITAVIEFTGSYLPEENMPCALTRLVFRRRHRAVPLADVPPLLLAECHADYAALAALGPHDPDWERKASL